MLKIKILNYFSVIAILVGMLFVALPVQAQNIPAGCPGGPPGPPAAGQQCGVIQNTSEAREFCRDENGLNGFIPVGQADPCYFPNPLLSDAQCSTTSTQADIQADCLSYTLQSMVGKQRQDLLVLAQALGEEAAENRGNGWSGNFTNDCRTSGELTEDNCGIISYLTLFIRVLSFAVGLVVTIMIVWGGIKYALSRDNPQETASAKEHVRNAIFALIIYIFMVALLNWLVPGGVI
jgi:hypothetical protein